MTDASFGDVKGRLKLKAEDADDVAILSAALQDAILPVSEMRFLKSDGLFALLVNRFRWEDAPQADPETGGMIHHRTHCGVRITGVMEVRTRNLDRSDPSRLLNLLSLRMVGVETLTMTFSGETALELTGEGLTLVLEDLGEPWPTSSKPDHDPPEG